MNFDQPMDKKPPEFWALPYMECMNGRNYRMGRSLFPLSGGEASSFDKQLRAAQP